MKKRFRYECIRAECQDCSWKTESPVNGQALAAIHARKYKHYVLVDICGEGHYDGRESKPQ